LVERVDSNSLSGQSHQNGFIALLAKCTGLEAAVSMRVHAACFFVIPSEVGDPAALRKGDSTGFLGYASLRSERRNNL